MSKTLYEISDELRQIVENIEENGGEVNEFIEEALAIKQEELESKVEAYCNLIAMTKGDIDCCKNEKQRINNIQNVKKNLVEKLRDRLLDAVLTWGEIGKTGNRVLNLPTHKLFTKDVRKVNVDEERFTTLTTYVQRYILELKKEGILVTGKDIDLTGMMAAINAVIRAEKGENYPPFKLSDLAMVKISVSTEVEFMYLLDGSHDYAIDAMLNPTAKVEVTADEDGLKRALTNAEEMHIELPSTIASLTTEHSLTIK